MPPIVPLLNKINQYILNPIIILGFSVALVVFLYGIFQFVLKAGDDKAREEGKKSIGYGLVGMFIMVSVFGIIRFILSSLGLSAANVYPLNPNP